MALIGIAGLLMGLMGDPDTGILGLVTLFTSISMFETRMPSRKSMKALIVFMLTSFIFLTILIINLALGGLVSYAILGLVLAIIAFMIAYSVINIQHLRSSQKGKVS